MKLPNWVKIIWWLILIILFALVLWLRPGNIMSIATPTMDIIIIIVLIALLIMPLFKEFSVLGISFKKEIDSLKSDIDRQIISLKSEVRNTIIFPTPSSDSELESLEERIAPILEKALEEKGIKKPKPTEQPKAPDDTQLLFSVRYALENELKRIAKWLWAPPKELRYRTPLQIADILARRETINPEVVDMIREVYAICSAAIHGDYVSEDLVNFVKDISPNLLAYLESIEEQTNEPVWKPKE